MKRLIAVVLFLAGGCSVAMADDCARSRTVYQTYQPTYYQPTYQASYQNYQYTPVYQTPVQTVVLVPKSVEVEVQYGNRDHYYSISPLYYEGQTIDKIAALLKQEREGNAGQPAQPPSRPVQPPPVQPPVQPTVTPPPPVQPTTPPPTQPGPVTINPTKAGTYQNPKLLAMFNARCVKCHQAENRMPLVTPDGKAILDLPKVACLDIYFRTNTGNMPKTAPPVEDEYMPLLAELIKASK